jgi:hypothetical protein
MRKALVGYGALVGSAHSPLASSREKETVGSTDRTAGDAIRPGWRSLSLPLSGSDVVVDKSQFSGAQAWLPRFAGFERHCFRVDLYPN